MSSVLAEGVVGKASEMVLQQAANEVSIVLKFREDLNGLKEQIKQINCFLNEADEKRAEQKESAKTWLRRVRDIAWEAEDILEECAVDATNNAHSCALNCNQLIFRYQMGKRIRKVKAKFSSVIDEGSKLEIIPAAARNKDKAESSSSSQGQPSKRWSHPPTDSKPVGLKPKIESVVSLLENPQFPIIAVVGMGGIGKTYLLQHVYKELKGRYDISAWLAVSQSYSVRTLQHDLAFQLDKGLNKEIIDGNISDVVAAERIHGFMLEKRCLVVLDDVWRESELPTKLGIPITDQASECKLLVSTRKRNVFKNPKAEIYEMELLTEEESWRLFCAHAFPKSEENRVPECVARNIVKECGRLPLAIKVTGASLANTRVSDWKSKLSQLQKVPTSKDNRVMKILKLSYHSLSAHLKACFAYLSYFPEDESIECEYLIYLWMGEGFIPNGEDPWDCLDQLVNLCLVEVWEEAWTLKKYCKIHDLLLDLAIRISSENKCAFGGEKGAGDNRWCRLFLAKKDIDERAIMERPPFSLKLVRTLSLSYNNKIGGNIPAMFFKSMRVLRVLDLSHTNICTLPACVREMKLLKVLNLRDTQIKKLPECVRYLKSLCFLDVSCCRLWEQRDAPKWISELKCLRHLEGPFKILPTEISKLDSLQALRLSDPFLSLSIQEDGFLRIEDVGKMREIEEIAFNVEDESQLEKMEDGILAPLEKMCRLQVSNKIAARQSDLPQFPEKLSATVDLEHLSLVGFAVPSWICRSISTLRYLSLWHCHCSDYPELQQIPNLVTLVLWSNNSCKELPDAFGKSGGFPSLRFFSIRNFPELVEFPKIENEAMRCLEKLELQHCEKLNKVGEGLEQLRRLKECSFEYSGTAALREVMKENGIYWEKNPQVIIKQ